LESLIKTHQSVGPVLIGQVGKNRCVRPLIMFMPLKKTERIYEDLLLSEVVYCSHAAGELF
jgi:hypothetical protein